MKLKSIDYLVKKSKESFYRFPLTILCATFSVICGIYLSELESENLAVIDLIMTFALGVPLYFCVSIFISKNKIELKLKIILQVLATISLFVVYFSLPKSSVNYISIPYIRYAIFSVVVHLLVSFAPFLKTKELNGFWNYNKILFLRFLTSILYSNVLYLGIILALSLIKELFNIKINGILYFQIFIIIIGLFNTWFFVSGIPEKIEDLESIREYPNGLKKFTQYILLPILILYLFILYIYGCKIILDWSWPKGIVSYLIIFVSLLGILSILLIYPYGNLKKNYWIKKFTTIYYYLLIPLIIILFIAIYFRVSDYGITINRYFIILLGVWLSALSLYFIFKKNNIKFIPISLSVMLIIISFGPWGIFSVSERSQVSRLRKILSENSIVVNNKIKNEVIWSKDSLPKLYSSNKETDEYKVNDSLKNEIRSIIKYLDKNHGFSEIQSLFTQNIDSIINVVSKNKTYLNETNLYMNTMGFKANILYNSLDKYFSYNVSSKNEVINIRDYDYLVNFYLNPKNIKNFKVYDKEYSMFINEKNKLLIDQESIQIDLNNLIKNLNKELGTKNTEGVDKNKMTLYHETNKLKLKIEFNRLSLKRENNTILIKSCDGKIFLYNKR